MKIKNFPQKNLNQNKIFLNMNNYFIPKVNKNRKPKLILNKNNIIILIVIKPNKD